MASRRRLETPVLADHLLMVYISLTCTVAHHAWQTYFTREAVQHGRSPLEAQFLTCSNPVSVLAYSLPIHFITDWLRLALKASYVSQCKTEHHFH